MPAEWDETIVLPVSKIGEIAAFARKKGSEWYIRIITEAKHKSR
ncbi:MAG: glycoside hydrolase family 97 C-terminal domain-containing protein [Rikenellaceae bacterium]|nr:glycoside hydrolase family 97 C-terminal domain-containing protein [Rikenellaceae bacterium]